MEIGLSQLLPFAKEAGPLAVFAVLFIAAITVAHKLWGGFFESGAKAQTSAIDSMQKLIERLNAEIDRLGRAEAKIMDRLAECEARHRTRDEEVEKLQTQVAALNVKLFRVGLGDPS